MPRSSGIVRERNKASIARRQFWKRTKTLQMINNASTYVPEDAHVPFFENLPEEKLPELYIEKETPSTSTPTLLGNRVVDVEYFIDQVRKLTMHDIKCTLGRMTFLGEKRNGLTSYFTYHCKSCNRTTTLTTQKPDTNVNQALVWGASSVGIGYSQTEELLSVMDIPMMMKTTYKKVETLIHMKWQQHLVEQMKENAQEEKRLAIEEGHYEQGIPYITVVVDGSWAKRTYGHSYSSLSGVACIIGYKTKKLVYIGVKNKFCYSCTVGSREHVCYKNYSGPSTSMEQTVIVEGFNRSESDYGIRYKYFVGDGDSSVYTRIIEHVTYGRYVVKLECANHCTRAFTAKLHNLVKNTTFSVTARNIIKSKIPVFSGLIRTIISRTSNVDELRTDLKNSMMHVFGDHENCRPEVCSKQTSTANNSIPLLRSSAILPELLKVCNGLVRKADRLTQNVTTNCAERYMAMIAKFTGGKRTNLVQKGIYHNRCFGAGLAYNMGPLFHALSTTKKDKYFLNNFSIRRSKRKVYKRKRRLINKNSQEDMDYGQNAAQPDQDDEEMELSKKAIVHELSSDDIFQIARDTIGQRQNIQWHQARRNRLTASNFGRICRRRTSTPSHNLIKELLYRNTDLKTKAIQYGIENERNAITRFESVTNSKVNECGFHVCNEYRFLGASPDGITENDELVEVKCLFSIRDKTVKKALESKAYLCVKMTSNGELYLKKSHPYFYQIQGQLNICQKQYCNLVLFTNKDIVIVQIERDRQFWQNTMLPKLIEFWEQCVLPELADPRIPRGLKARDRS